MKVWNEKGIREEEGQKDPKEKDEVKKVLSRFRENNNFCIFPFETSTDSNSRSTFT